MSKKPITRRSALKLLGATGGIGLAGCSSNGGGDGGDGGNGGSDDGGGDGGDGSDGGGQTESSDGSSGGEQMKAAWIYVSEVGDLGWSWAHDQGRKKTDQAFDWLTTEYSEAVSNSDFPRVCRDYSRQGYDTIFGTSFGYNDAMLTISEEYPDIAYEHCSGYNNGDNLGIYYGKSYEARYLSGYAAGMVTETNKIGYVAAFPIASVLQEMNGFAAGVMDANPEASIIPVWTNTWFDPPKVKKAARSLIDQDVDVMSQHQDSPAAVKVANENDIWAIGYDAPMGEFGGDNYLTGVLWHWDVFYKMTMQNVKQDDWEPGFWFGGLKSGVTGLDEWGPEVPENVRSTVDSRRQEIIDGSLNVWEGTQYDGKSEDFFYYDINSLAQNYDGKVPD